MSTTLKLERMTQAFGSVAVYARTENGVLYRAELAPLCTTWTVSRWESSRAKTERGGMGWWREADGRMVDRMRTFAVVAMEAG